MKGLYSLMLFFIYFSNNYIYASNSNSNTPMPFSNYSIKTFKLDESTTFNLLSCKAVSSTTCVTVLCIDQKKAFIFTLADFSTYFIQNSSTYINTNAYITLNDDNFRSIQTDGVYILISSKQFFYLIKDTANFKKIQFPFSIYNSSNFYIVQAKVFLNTILAQIKMDNVNSTSNSLKTTNYLFLFFFEFTTNFLDYWYMNQLYGLPQILNYELLNFEINYCRIFLKVEESDESVCLYLSDFGGNIDKTSVDYTTYNSKSSYLYIYILRLNKNSPDLIGIELVDKVKIPFSCGVNIKFTDYFAILGCPYIETVVSNVNEINFIIGGIAVYTKNTRNSNSITADNSYNYTLFANTNLVDIYNSNTNSIVTFAAHSYLVEIDDNNFQYLTVDLFNGIVYIINIAHTPFYFTDSNAIEFSSFFLELGFNQFYGLGTEETLVDSIFMKIDDLIIFWNTAIDISLYPLEANTNNQDTLSSLYSAVVFGVCNPGQAYDSSIGFFSSISFCKNCANYQTSEGVQMKSCGKCEADNLNTIYQNIHSCKTDLCVSNPGQFGENCQTCENFLNSFYLPEISNVSSYIGEYINGQVYCDFQCKTNYTRIGWDCVNVEVYTNNEGLYTTSIVDNTDKCSKYTSCFECANYYSDLCTWCYNDNECYTSNMTSCFNRTEAGISDVSQIQCINYYSQDYCGKVKFYDTVVGNITLPPSINSTSIESTASFPKFLICKYEVKFSELEDLELDIIINNNDYLSDIEVHELLYNKTYILNLKIENEIVEIKSSEIEIFIKLNDKFLGNLTQPVVDINYSSKPAVGFSLFNILMISISLGLVFIISIAVVIYYLCRRNKENEFRNRIKKIKNSNLEQEENKALQAKHIGHNDFSTSQLNINEIKLKSLKNLEYQKKFNKLIKEKFPKEEMKVRYLRSVINSMPMFVLDDLEFTSLKCAFCESNFKLNEKLCLFKCDHITHLPCLEQQLLISEKYFCMECDGEIIKIN